MTKTTKIQKKVEVATSWIGAKRIATRDGYEVVYYDHDEGIYGACPQGQPQGHFEGGQFIRHECTYYPASFSERKIEEIEWEQRR